MDLGVWVPIVFYPVVWFVVEEICVVEVFDEGFFEIGDEFAAGEGVCLLVGIDYDNESGIGNGVCNFGFALFDHAGHKFQIPVPDAGREIYFIVGENFFAGDYSIEAVETGAIVYEVASVFEGVVLEAQEHLSCCVTGEAVVCDVPVGCFSSDDAGECFVVCNALTEGE